MASYRLVTYAAATEPRAGIVIGDSILASDEDWLRVALRDHPRTHTLAILSAAVALHPGVLIRD